MAKAVDNSVLDGALNIIKNGAIKQAVCTSQPANFAAISAARLAEATMSTGDYTIAAGSTPSAGLGRKVTMTAKSGVTINASGTASHIVLHDNVSVMHYVTTCTSQLLTTGGGATVNLPTWAIEIAGPT